VAVAGMSQLTPEAAVLNGSSSSDSDHDPLVYAWEQLAGPTYASIVNPTAALTQVSGLKQGEYYFKLTVDDGKDVDFDLVKVVYDSRTNITDVLKNELIIYPNPVKDKIYISKPASDTSLKIRIIDITGKTILVKSGTSDIIECDLKGCNAGLYTLVTDGNSGIKICKFVKK